MSVEKGTEEEEGGGGVIKGLRVRRGLPCLLARSRSLRTAWLRYVIRCM